MTKPSVGRKLRQRRFERNGWSLAGCAIEPLPLLVSWSAATTSLRSRGHLKAAAALSSKPRAGTGGRMDERTIVALTMLDGEDAYQATKTRKTYGRLWDLPHPQILLLGIACAFWGPIFYRGDEKRSTSLLRNINR